MPKILGRSAISKAKENSAIFLPAKGSAKLTGCTVTGATAVETVGLTKLDLLGTTKLTATLESHTTPNRNSGSSPSGSALLIVSHGSYSKNQTLNVYIDENVTFEKNQKATDADGIEVYEESGNTGINNVYLKTKKSSITAKQNELSGCTLHTQTNVEYDGI